MFPGFGFCYFYLIGTDLNLIQFNSVTSDHKQDREDEVYYEWLSALLP